MDFKLICDIQNKVRSRRIQNRAVNEARQLKTRVSCLDMYQSLKQTRMVWSQVNDNIYFKAVQQKNPEVKRLGDNIRGHLERAKKYVKDQQGAPKTRTLALADMFSLNSTEDRDGLYEIIDSTITLIKAVWQVTWLEYTDAKSELKQITREPEWQISTVPHVFLTATNFECTMIMPDLNQAFIIRELAGIRAVYNGKWEDIKTWPWHGIPITDTKIIFMLHKFPAPEEPSRILKKCPHIEGIKLE